MIGLSTAIEPNACTVTELASAAGPVEVRLADAHDGPRLELTYNVGRAEPYEVGTGYGHIAITVDDLDATLKRLAGVGIEPERPPYSVREGGSRLCFVRDPDDYRIELIESDR